MPFVRISMFPRTPEVRKALAKDLTEVIAKHCQIPVDATWIVFDEIEKDHWAMGGNLRG